MKQPASRKQPLYQVFVENEEGNLLPVSPAMLKEACEQFEDAIRTQIAAGKERVWSNPHTALVMNLH